MVIPCDRHAALFAAPADISCPWCAQEARQAAYLRQRTEATATLARAARRIPKPVTTACEPMQEAAD